MNDIIDLGEMESYEWSDSKLGLSELVISSENGMKVKVQIRKHMTRSLANRAYNVLKRKIKLPRIGCN